MPSTISSNRYNKDTNSNINLFDLQAATGRAYNLNDYRGKAGVPATGAVSFSDLRGFVSTADETSQYLVPGQGTSDSTYENYWIYARYRSSSWGNGYYGSWYNGGTVSNAYVPASGLGYYYNGNTGGYNWGVEFPRSASGQSNMVIAVIFNTKIHMYIGNLASSTEKAMAFGHIGLRQRDSGNNAVAGLSNVVPFNIFVGQSVFTTGYPDIENSIFRTTTRSYLKGIWITGNNLYWGTLTTSPFQTGAAMSAASATQILSSSTTYHINNTIGLGLGYHYDDTQAAQYLPVLQMYDIGVRNVKSYPYYSTSILDTSQLTDNTVAVPSFLT